MEARASRQPTGSVLARGVAPVSSALRQWLERLGLAQYGDRFEADDIDLDVVPSLSESDLEKLGVSMGHRKRLLKAIAELGTGASPTAGPGLMTGAPARSADQREGRKVVTIVFADLAGSTALHERLDPESVRRFMERICIRSDSWFTSHRPYPSAP